MRTHQQKHWVTPTTARQVLTGLANLPDESAAPTGHPLLLRIKEQVGALAHHFPEVFDELRPLLTGKAGPAGLLAQGSDGPFTDPVHDPFVSAVAGLSRHVREVWKLAQHPREAEWMIFELRQLHKRLSVRALNLPEFAESSPLIAKDIENWIFWGWWPDRPPALTAFEQMMYHFHRMLPQARFCANQDCQTPHFFAHKRRRYCTEKCARLAQAEYKKRWWHDRGSKRRRQALRKQKLRGRPKHDESRVKLPRRV